MIHKKRLNRLFKQAGKKVDAILIHGDTSLLRYLTGHGEGSAVATRRGVEFVVARMFAEAAEKTGLRVHIIDKGMDFIKTIQKVIAGAKILGFRFSAVSYPLFFDLKKKLKGMSFVDISTDVMEISVQKDEKEINLLRDVCKDTARVAKLVPEMLKNGMTEIELMREISYAMTHIGGGMVSFGENTSHPHHQPSKRKLRKGDFVMVDFGCMTGGVGSDITRTICFGKASKKQKEVYAEVKEGQDLAFSMIKEGKEVADINKAVDDMFKSKGYGPFIHSIGHCLGYFGGGFRNVENNIVTVEPGIYIPGFGGVRIEDDVLITKKGFLNLTALSPAKELIEV